MVRVISFFIALFFISCSGARETGSNIKKNDSKSAVDKISTHLAAVSEINKNSPVSISADMDIDGSLGKKKIKLTGKLLYTAEPSMLNFNLYDYVFKSPVLFLFQEGNAVRLYSATEKKVFADRFKSINLKNYIGASIDFLFLYSLISGKIPLIDDYKVKSHIEDSRGSYLILENKIYYQTISFEGNTPDKILIMNRETQEKYEIYLTLFKKDKSSYFKKVRFVMASSSIKIEVQFKLPQINTPVKTKTISEMKVPNDVPVLNVGQ